MEYLVFFPDGQSFGPADIPTLAQWAREGRLLPQTVLENMSTRERVTAGTVAGIFQAQPGMGPQMGGQFQQPGYPRFNPQFQGFVPAQPINGMAIASLVIGIISICIFCVPILGAALGALAVGLGIPGKKDNSAGVAIAGIVCGALGALFGIAWTVYVFTGGMHGNWYRS
jgi:hypothetical protein